MSSEASNQHFVHGARQCGRWNADLTLADRVYACRRCEAKIAFHGMEDALARIRERSRQKTAENGAVATRTPL